MFSCKSCGDSLVFRVGEDEGEIAEEVPDDVELSCGCHFHWQCLLDESSTVALSLRCPHCETYLGTDKSGAPPAGSSSAAPASSTAIVVQYKNEGGLESDLDILPAITEEAYLSNHPEARPARAFQVMCSEGDVAGLVELLADVDGRGDDDISVPSVLRYQDPLSDMRTGLHLAIEKAQPEVALLLLWLCSTAQNEAFPPDSREIAQSQGVGRISTDSDGDIRKLKDAHGLTAGDYARHHGGPWIQFLDAGLL